MSLLCSKVARKGKVHFWDRTTWPSVNFGFLRPYFSFQAGASITVDRQAAIYVLFLLLMEVVTIMIVWVAGVLSTKSILYWHQSLHPNKDLGQFLLFGVFTHILLKYVACVCSSYTSSHKHISRFDELFTLIFPMQGNFVWSLPRCPFMMPQQIAHLMRDT